MIPQRVTDTLSLVPASINDSEFVYSVRKQAVGDYVAQVWGWDEQVQREFHAKSFDPTRTFLIRHEQSFVGHMMVTEDQDYVVFDSLHILPPHQGHGIGTLLLRHVISFAETIHLPVRLRVLRINPAKILYERLGFVVTSETDTHYAMERGVTHAH